MEYRSFTVAEAASQLKISHSTLRRWCSDFADHLSEGARPDKGVYRRLSSNDLQILAEAKALRDQGLSVPVINDRLGDVVFQSPIIESPQALPASRSEAIVPAIVVESLQSIEDRLQALESQRQRVDVVFLVVMAFVAGLLVGSAAWWFR